MIEINEIPNVIDDNVLNLVGNAFKFDHAKGMAEWLKNSVDAYRRDNVRQEDQDIVFRFTDQGVPRPTIECIDFMGMTLSDINKALKIWFDPDAAKRGTDKKVYGGHGNGGKFYMRQMFRESQFMTYKDGILNIFGFNENKRYGFAQGYEDKEMNPIEAMKFAGIDVLPIGDELRGKIAKGECGFTVAKGVGPKKIRTKFQLAREIDKFRNYSQSRRILERSNVSIVHNGRSFISSLKPAELRPMEEFKEPRIIEIPRELTVHSGSEVVKMANEQYPPGKLVLKTSAEALTKGSKLGELNRIDILGEIGVLASYQLASDLEVTGFPDAAFIYGEFAPANDGDPSILEDPSNDCVSNDRVHLTKNDMTQALLGWIAIEIDKLAGAITALKSAKEKVHQKKITSKFNDVLNKWKNKHMKKIMSELFPSAGQFGGTGSNGGGGGVGIEVTPPPNGFDFKYPKSEIVVDVPTRATLKISVPESLPVGAMIFVKSNSDKVSLEESKYPIKSDCLKATPDGREVAFINVDIVGTEVGAEATVTAEAGRFTATTNVKVVAQKKGESGKSFPQVLLSSIDPDPLGLAPAPGYLILGKREAVVYQRPQDFEHNIYWINTSSPMASKIYEKFTSDSIQWRNFLFERYVDIFVKEAIHELEKRDFANFAAATVDLKIAEVIRSVHQSANDDLEHFLFDDGYVA